LAVSESLVLVMNADGSLVASDPQAEFSEHYGWKLDEEIPVMLFGGAEPENPLKPPAPRVASPEILLAIEDAALRYARSDELRRAGLSVTDWMALYRANIEIESGYDPAAESRVGAIGLGQLMPETATLLGVDPYVLAENLDGSARYLLAMLDRFGDAQLALAAYNAGPEAVEKHGGIPPFAETQGHVQKVMAVVARLNGEEE
jgi:hypothetical protein